MKMRRIWDGSRWRVLAGWTTRSRGWLRVPPLAAVGLGLGLGLSGCGPRNFANENDRLRTDNLKLQREVRTLKKRLNLRGSQLATLRQQVDRGRHPVPGAAPPRLAKLKLGRYSAAIDTNDDGNDDAVRVYLETLDGKGRFIPVSGKVSLQVVAVQADHAPHVLAKRTFDPKAFSAAYRTGLTGTHYTLQTPLPDKLPSHKIDATAVVTLVAGANGVKLTTQTPLRIVRTP